MKFLFFSIIQTFFALNEIFSEPSEIMAETVLAVQKRLFLTTIKAGSTMLIMEIRLMKLIERVFTLGELINACF